MLHNRFDTILHSSFHGEVFVVHSMHPSVESKDSKPRRIRELEPGGGQRLVEDKVAAKPAWIRTRNPYYTAQSLPYHTA